MPKSALTGGMWNNDAAILFFSVALVSRRVILFSTREENMKHYSKIIDQRDIQAKLYDDGTAVVLSQAVNPKTGKGWQKNINIENFTSHNKALWAWAKRRA